MSKGKYGSAFDRVHTGFHGYLRKLLDDIGVEYFESDSLSQLYSKLHKEIRIQPKQVAELVRTIIRSTSGVISSINSIRNNHSLAHPNEDIIGEREAVFAIKIVKNLSDYINSIL